MIYFEPLFGPPEPEYTKTEALSKAMNIIKRKLQRWIIITFPNEGILLELKEADGDSAISIVTSLGSEDDIKKRQQFDILLLIWLRGRKRLKLIGSAKCEDVEGEHRSVCRVTKGAKEIYGAFTQNPDDIIVQAKSTVKQERRE